MLGKWYNQNHPHLLHYLQWLFHSLILLWGNFLNQLRFLLADLFHCYHDLILSLWLILLLISCKVFQFALLQVKIYCLAVLVLSFFIFAMSSFYHKSEGYKVYPIRLVANQQNDACVLLHYKLYLHFWVKKGCRLLRFSAEHGQLQCWGMKWIHFGVSTPLHTDPPNYLAPSHMAKFRQ